MLAELWSGGYLLDWAGLIFEFLGATLAAFGILPSTRYMSHLATSEQDTARVATIFLLQQSKQVKLGMSILAIGSLLQCIATFQAAMPLFGK